MAVTTNNPARKPINALIIDAGPILSASAAPTYYLSQADRLLTTPSVVAEIRDEAARARFETQWRSFLVVRTPRPGSLKHVAEFAKRTGDYQALSRTDLELIALGYEVELEVSGGDWRLRAKPGQKDVNGPMPEWWKKGLDGPEVEDEVKEEVVDEKKTEEEEKQKKEEDVKTGDGKKTEELAEGIEKVKLEGEQAEPAVVVEEEDSEDDSTTDDSDGGEWITPSNLHKKRQPIPSEKTTPISKRKLTVALATTDYSMQNVLLQMNLHLCSPTSLMQIKNTRSTVLRCHACFYILRNPSASSDFCPRCGGVKTLLRTSCSTDANGIFRVYLKKNFQWNNRGNVFSLPKPQHGTSSMKGVPDAPVLREDQKEYQRAMRREKWRKEKDLLDPDILPGILTGQRRQGPYVTVGSGKRNPNETRKGGRKKR